MSKKEPHPDQLPQPHLDIDPSSALQTLKRLRVPGEGVHTSEGENFNHTLFARDSAIAARELLERDPTIAHEAILMLAAKQGTGIDTHSDEEPGRIHHEYRDMNEWKAGLPNRLVRSAMSVVWGGTTRKMMTYFSMDSTPLYTQLVADYSDTHPSVLSETVKQHDGEEVSIAESLAAAADWMVSHKTKDNLIEIPRHNKYGLPHQTWKDSLTGYIHENGDSLNLSQPIAYLEVQALVIDGLIRSAATLKGTYPEKAAVWKKAATEITRATLQDFWQEDSQYFISSIDRDKHGEHRRNGVEQSDPGWMLNTGMFDDLPEEERKKYITGIITTLFSDNFLTDAGIRSRSLEYARANNVVDYHGSLVTWPSDTYMISRGLRRQGFFNLADQLDARILNSVNIAGDFYEFFIVEKDGTVLLNIDAAMKKNPGAKRLAVQLLPDKGIAWTVAAALEIKDRNTRQAKYPPQPSLEPWKRKLEEEILAQIPNVTPIKTRAEMQQKFAANPGVYIDTFQGAVETANDLWEAFRLRLDSKTKKLSNHAIKTHQI